MQKCIKWVGMDVHKSSNVIAILEDDQPQGEALTITIDNEPKAIRRLMKRLSRDGSELRTCYEAGPCGFEIHRLIHEMGISCDVIAPSLIPKKAGERIKTDRRDARKLASLYRAGLLTSIAVPDEDQEAIRDLVRSRESVVRDVRAARHQLVKFLLRRGRIFRETRNWTQKHRVWIRQQVFEHAATQKAFEHYRTHLEYLEERQAELEAEIESIAADEPYRTAVGRLMCLRGIKVITAMILVSEIYDFRRFPNAPAFTAYLGLVPSEHSSGGPGNEKRGGITKTGNKHVRRALVEAAWHYRHPPSLQGALKKRIEGQDPGIVRHAWQAQRRLNRTYWKMVAKGKQTPVAVTAVARELAGFVWALMVDDDLHQEVAA